LRHINEMKNQTYKNHPMKRGAFLISVIIPIYNSGRTLDECVKSISKQSYKEWELILIDSNSNDDTPLIAQKWIKLLGESKLKYFNIRRKEQPTKRNFGIKRAHGELLFFHDSDQYLSPATFEECLKLIEEGYAGVNIPQVSDFDGKSYFSKCNIMSIELFTFDEGVRVPSMVKKEYVELLYQGEDLDWVDDNITVARFKERGLNIGSIQSHMIHDRDIPMRSLVFKTRFIVKASKKWPGNPIIHDDFIYMFARKMLLLNKSQPIYVPGILLAFLTRTITRIITTVI
jgi:glycosyltransferase involved in cell wall biosynthesis